MHIDPCMKCLDLQIPLCDVGTGKRDHVALAVSYLKSGRSTHRVINHNAAFECVWTMALDNPDEALEFINVALEYAETGQQEAYLAAGVLECPLVKHGPIIIERVLTAARSDTKLRRCLLGVWGFSGMNKAVRQRLDCFLALPLAAKKRKR
jgi:hypothetical protein